MQTLPTWTTSDHPCEYLPDRVARMEYAFAVDLSSGEYEAMMNRGWRKFGQVLFRPVCAACDECKPIRIPVERFAPNRSRKRTLRRCADLTVVFGPPRCDAARLDLYNRYHTAQEAIRGWSESTKTADEYLVAFVQNPIPAVEISIWDGSSLRAIVLADVTPNVVSAVYHFYAPDDRGKGVGMFALLQIVTLARRLGKPYIHLGYYVADCPSLSYKATFQPNEFLEIDESWHAANGEA